MGTPESNVFFQTMLRKEKLTAEEWNALLKARVERMWFFLHHYTLEALSAVAYRESDIQTPVFIDDKTLLPEEYRNTQGIFAACRLAGERRWLIFGLTRSSKWIACTIQEVNARGRYLIKEIEVRLTTPDELYHMGDRIQYSRLLFLLSGALKQRVEKQREQLALLEACCADLEAENCLLLSGGLRMLTI